MTLARGTPFDTNYFTTSALTVATGRQGSTVVQAALTRAVCVSCRTDATRQGEERERQRRV